MDYMKTCEEISKDVEDVIRKYFPESEIVETPSVSIEFGDIDPTQSTNTLKISCEFTK